GAPCWCGVSASPRRRAASWGGRRGPSKLATPRRSVASRWSITRSRTSVSSLMRARARNAAASWPRSLAASSIAERRAVSSRPSSLRARPIPSWIENSASRPLNITFSPARNTAFERGHPKLGLQEPAALLRHTRILHDSILGLIAAHRLEDLHRHADRKTRNGFHLIGLIIAHRH